MDPSFTERVLANEKNCKKELKIIISNNYTKKYSAKKQGLLPCCSGVEYFKMNMSFENTTGQKGMQTRHILESPLMFNYSKISK